MTHPPDVLLMGVSGSGKSTVGKLLAAGLGSTFLDADDFHPPGNVEKMAAGMPLTDDDRRPWLEAIATKLDEMRAAGSPFVLACSALKHSYRSLLSQAAPELVVVLLNGSPELIGQRLAARKDHFMPTTLLDSQFEALEAPADSIQVGIDQPPEEVVAGILAALDLRR